ncbi:MAG TPA: hypothetical protein VIY48_17515 [Candidatus Paceibacterota bacterium]
MSAQQAIDLLNRAAEKMFDVVDPLNKAHDTLEGDIVPMLAEAEGEPGVSRTITEIHGAVRQTLDNLDTITREAAGIRAMMEDHAAYLTASMHQEE